MYGRSIHTKSILEQRLGFLLMGVASLCSIRILDNLTSNQYQILLVFSRIAGSLTIFSSVLLIEAIKRRHFALWIKLSSVTLFLIMLVISVTNLPHFYKWTGWLFLISGSILLAGAVAATVFRDRRDVTAIENYLLNSCQLAAAIAFLFTTYEFYANDFSSNVVLRASPVATLVLISFFARISNGTENFRSLVFEQLKNIFKMSLVTVAILFTLLGRFETGIFLMLLTLLWGLRLVVSISEYVHFRYREHADASLMLKIGEIQGISQADLLTALTRMPWFSDFDLISEHDLQNELRSRLIEFYSASPGDILSLSSHAIGADKSAGRPSHDFSAEDIVSSLLQRSKRTHAICISLRPITLILLTVPEIAGGVTSALRFSMIQRLALTVRPTKGLIC